MSSDLNQGLLWRSCSNRDGFLCLLLLQRSDWLGFLLFLMPLTEWEISPLWNRADGKRQRCSIAKLCFFVGFFHPGEFQIPASFRVGPVLHSAKVRFHFPLLCLHIPCRNTSQSSPKNRLSNTRLEKKREIGYTDLYLSQKIPRFTNCHPHPLRYLCNRAAGREALKENGEKHQTKQPNKKTDSAANVFLCICILMQSFTR